MKSIYLKSLLFLIMGLAISSCNTAQSVLEVTTFKIKSTSNSIRFNQLDAEVEKNFTSQQPGFIHRQSGLSESGEYVVLVHWESIENAKASMDKFMTDASVADFASMIEGSSMKMDRYTINTKFNAKIVAL